MCEGWLRHHAAAVGLDAEVQSAGTIASKVKPEAVQVMREVRIDISSHTSKTLEDLPDVTAFDIVMTVCDAANEACPILPTATTRLHVSFHDPSGHDLKHWREVRDAIGEASRRLVEELLTPVTA